MVAEIPPLRTKAGKPFRSERSAKAFVTRNGLADTHEVSATDGGFELTSRSPEPPSPPAPAPAKPSRGPKRKAAVKASIAKARKAREALTSSTSSGRKAKVVSDTSLTDPDTLAASASNVSQHLEDEISAQGIKVADLLERADLDGTDIAELRYNVASKKLRTLQAKSDKLSGLADGSIPMQASSDNILDDLYDDTSPLSANTGTPTEHTEATFNKLTNVVSKFSNLLTDSRLSIVLVDSVDALPAHLKDRAGIESSGGILDRKSTKVYLVGSNIKDAAQATTVILHEVVGHYGMRATFEQVSGRKGAYTKFLERESRRSSPIMQEAASLVLGHGNHKDLYTTSSPETPYNILSVNGESVFLTKSQSASLLDEYIAYRSEQIVLDPEFSRKYGALGKRLLAVVRHVLRKAGLGGVALSPEDVNSLLAESNRRLFDLRNESMTGVHRTSDITPSVRLQIAKYTDPTSPLFSSLAAEMNGLAPVGAFARENAAEQARIAELTPLKQKVLKARLKSVDALADAGALAAKAGEGDAQEGGLLGAWGRRVDAQMDTLRSSPLLNRLKFLAPLGGVPDKNLLRDLNAQARGAIANGEVVTARLTSVFKGMNTIQKEAVATFFTSKGASASLIPGITAKQSEDINAGKDFLEDLGSQLVSLGLLQESVYLNNKGSYLPRIYYKYLLQGGATSGRRISFMGYLSKQKDLPPEQRVELGKIIDVTSTLPSTLATIARDVALTKLTRRIVSMSASQQLNWVIGETLIPVVGSDGKQRSMSLYDLEADVVRLRDQLVAPDGALETLIEDKQFLPKRIAYLESRIAKAVLLRDGEVADLVAKGGVDRADVTDELVLAYINSNYSKMPVDKAYGALSGTMVLKAIREEFVDSVALLADGSEIGREVDRAVRTGHQAWKASKVVLNAPVSTVRNSTGNLVLLDQGSNVPIHKIARMVLEEAQHMFSDVRDSSRFRKYSHAMGLESTTFAATELNLMRRTLKGDIEMALKLEKVKGSSWHLPVFAGVQATKGFLSVTSKLADFYGLQETVFKATAVRIHVEQWEKSTGTSLEDPSIPATTKEAVLLSAARYANTTIFDYSEVPGLLGFIRSYPLLGSPFVTFTYKSLQAVPVNMVKHPQKFIKYGVLTSTAMLSALGTYSDWEEDEAEQVVRALPEYYRNSSAILVLPFKDANGRPQVTDLSVFLPQAPHLNVLKSLYNSGGSIGKMSDALLSWSGVGSAPLLTLSRAIIDQENPFTGRPLSPPGSSFVQQLEGIGTYIASFVLPPLYTETGAVGHLLDNAGIDAPFISSGREFDRLGGDYETASQAALRVIGLNVKGVDPVLARSNLGAAFRRDMRDLTSQRRRIARSQNNLDEKPAKIKALNDRIRALRLKFSESVE